MSVGEGREKTRSGQFRHIPLLNPHPSLPISHECKPFDTCLLFVANDKEKKKGKRKREKGKGKRRVIQTKDNAMGIIMIHTCMILPCCTSRKESGEYIRCVGLHI